MLLELEDAVRVGPNETAELIQVLADDVRAVAGELHDVLQLLDALDLLVHLLEVVEHGAREDDGLSRDDRRRRHAGRHCGGLRLRQEILHLRQVVLGPLERAFDDLAVLLLLLFRLRDRLEEQGELHLERLHGRRRPRDDLLDGDVEALVHRLGHGLRDVGHELLRFDHGAVLHGLHLVVDPKIELRLLLQSLRVLLDRDALLVQVDGEELDRLGELLQVGMIDVTLRLQDPQAHVDVGLAVPARLLHHFVSGQRGPRLSGGRTPAHRHPRGAETPGPGPAAKFAGLLDS